MLKLMVDYDVMFYVMGVVAVIGICSKMISEFTLKRLVRASSNMNKSAHKLLKLMKAKYEHACMVSDRVQNVNAFVDKYVHEYSILGLRLHTWQQMQKQTMWMSALLGVIGAGMYYQIYGMGEAVYRYAGGGATLMMLLLLLQLTTDEKYLLKTAEVYMIDYLENVCAHRYEKMYQKESAGIGEQAVDREAQGEDLRQEAGQAVMAEETAGTKVQAFTGNVNVSRGSESAFAGKNAGAETAQAFTESASGGSENIFSGKNVGSFRTMMDQKETEEAEIAQQESIIRKILEEFLAQRT